MKDVKIVIRLLIMSTLFYRRGNLIRPQDVCQKFTILFTIENNLLVTLVKCDITPFMYYYLYFHLRPAFNIRNNNNKTRGVKRGRRGLKPSFPLEIKIFLNIFSNTLQAEIELCVEKYLSSNKKYQALQ